MQLMFCTAGIKKNLSKMLTSSHTKGCQAGLRNFETLLQPVLMESQIMRWELVSEKYILTMHSSVSFFLLIICCHWNHTPWLLQSCYLSCDI